MEFKSSDSIHNFIFSRQTLGINIIVNLISLATFHVDVLTLNSDSKYSSTTFGTSSIERGDT